ncbi:MAG: hypothetical protein PGN13_08780 [Patulibacter minatonensis]
MSDRRQLIADTSLAIIGTDGIRALTHHRIDDDAGLPRGSTSYYCRRRVDILREALVRLYELDLSDLQAAAATLDPAAFDPAAARAAVAELVHGWLEGDARTRSIARIELFMAASHEPELHPLMTEQLAGMRTAALPFVARADGAGARRIGAAFMLTEGLVLAVLREGRPAPSAAQVGELLALLD